MSLVSIVMSPIRTYLYPICLTFGCIGNIFILIIFNQQRTNVCSLYLRVLAVMNFLYLLYSGFTQIFPASYINVTLKDIVLCKLQYYIPSALGQVGKSMLIYACIDRYMVTSERALVRAFSTIKQAKYLIVIAILVWLILPIHTIVFTYVDQGQCTKSATYSIFLTLYSLIVINLIPTIMFILFTYLTLQNMKQVGRRARINTKNFLQQRERDLLILIISEIIFQITTTILYPIIQFEMLITQYIFEVKPYNYIQLETVLFQISLLLLYMNSAAPFFIYLLSAKSFRQGFIQLFITLYNRTKQSIHI